MTAVKAGDVDKALAQRSPAVFALLFYGRDAGRVAERAAKAAREAVADPSDPFQLIRLDGDRIADEPGLLVEELATFGLFGASRSVWIRPTTRSIAGAVEASLAEPREQVLLVIEGGDLARTAPLRAVCERSPRALALPCYEDDARSLRSVVEARIKAAGMTITREACDMVVDSLGADRLASRGEVDKLLLYCHGQAQIGADDVLAAISDVSATQHDAVLDAAFAGDVAGLALASRRLWAEGANPAQLLGALARHLTGLAQARTAIEAGRSAEAALAGWRGLYFGRRPAVATQLRRWRSQDIVALAAAATQATLQTRQFPASAAAITETLLLRIARTARSGVRP